MKVVASVAALLVCALVPGIAFAQTATVSRAGGVLVVTQRDPSAALAGAELAVPAGLDREQLAQNGIAALTAETIVLTPVDGVPLNEAIAAHGGSIRFTIEPTGVRFYAEATAEDATAVFTLFARALSAPDFSPATVNAARRRLIADVDEEQDEPLAVGIEMLHLSLSSGNNVGLPQLGSAPLLAQLSLDDVAAFYHAYYRRGGTSLSIAGNVDAAASEALQSLATTLPEGTTNAVATRLTAISANGQYQLIARRDVSAPWLVVEYAAPSVKSADYGTMLVLAAFLQRMLGDVAEVPVTITPTETSEAVGALYDYDAASPSLVLYVDGGIGEPDRTFGAALSVVSVLGGTKLEGSIDQFKRIAAGDFLMSASTLESQARLAGIFARRTGSAAYVDATMREIAATTPADLQRVARRYLGKPTIALVLPRSTQN